jgi:hypothetical protein
MILIVRVLHLMCKGRGILSRPDSDDSIGRGLAVQERRRSTRPEQEAVPQVEVSSDTAEVQREASDTR